MGTWFFYLSLSSILVSYLSSLNAFRLGLSITYKKFSFFLLFVLLGEIFGTLWSRKLHLFLGYSNNNQWFHNIFHFICTLFFIFFFYRLYSFRNIKKITKWLTLIYILFAIGNYCLGEGVWKLNAYTELLSCFIMVFLSIAYYYQLLYSKEIMPLNTNPAFWVATGLLIYNLGSMMGLFLINVMNSLSNEKAKSIHLIIQAAAIIMYINFSISFLCRRKK